MLLASTVKSEESLPCCALTCQCATDQGIRGGPDPTKKDPTHRSFPEQPRMTPSVRFIYLLMSFLCITERGTKEMEGILPGGYFRCWCAAPAGTAQ